MRGADFDQFVGGKFDGAGAVESEAEVVFGVMGLRGWVRGLGVLNGWTEGAYREHDGRRVGSADLVICRVSCRVDLAAGDKEVIRGELAAKGLTTSCFSAIDEPSRRSTAVILAAIFLMEMCTATRKS